MSADTRGRRPRSRSPLDARSLARLVRRSGRIALAEPPGPARAQRAAQAIESWLAREGRSLRPRLAVEPVDRLTPLPRREWLLTVDALDGVDAYLAGLPTWCVSLGLLHRGVPHAAAVFAPALEDLYVASSGHLRWNGDIVDTAASQPPGFILGSGLEKRSILRLRRRREAEGPVAYHACLVARGAADGAVLGRLSLREAASILSILGPSDGSLLSLRSGAPIDLDQLRAERATRDTLVASRPDRAEAVLDRLKR